MANLIIPTEFSGLGKDFASGIEKAGLAGKEFEARCPPAVLPGTRILGVCGITDFKGQAAPDHDGWFFSDFFLFHHLMRNTSSHQIWMTCADPKDLVSKYEQYTDGDPRTSERKIVLDVSLLPDVADVRVFSCKSDGNALCERFLSTLRDECRVSREAGTSMLVLIFGHGSNRHHIFLGGKLTKNGTINGCHLTREAFRAAAGKHPALTLITTSCYGGGWAQTLLLNTSILAGADNVVEFLSWPASDSASRACSGIFITGLSSTFENLENSPQTSDTYAALAQAVHCTVFNELTSPPDHRLTFAAQDDKWGDEWRARTGIPLAHYQEQWDVLKSVPKGAASQTAHHTGSVKLRGFGSSFNSVQFESIVYFKAQSYLSSFPGLDNQAKNHWTHLQCRRLLNGQQGVLSTEQLEDLNAELDYRLFEVMGWATACKDHLGLEFPNCHAVPAFSQNFGEGLFDLVASFDLFPEGGWDKGTPYLALAITRAGWSHDRAKASLEQLETSIARAQVEQARTHGLQRDRTVRGLLVSLSQTTKKRLCNDWE